MSLAKVKRMKGKRGSIIGYVVVKDGKDQRSYLIKDYPNYGYGGARDLAHTEARRLNSQRNRG